MAGAVKPTGTITLVQSDVHYGDHITFNVTTSNTPTYARLTAKQNGTVVAIGFTDSSNLKNYTTDTTGMYSPIWTGGAAEIYVELLLMAPHKKDRVIGTTNFSVAA